MLFSQRRGGDKARLGSAMGSHPDLLLQWGNRKRLRCVKIQVKSAAADNTTTTTTVRRVVRADHPLLPPPSPPAPPSTHRVLRRKELSGGAAMRMSHRMTAGRIANEGNAAIEDDGKKGGSGSGTSSGGSEGVTWPKLVISLSNREKEEDFMVFKGCSKLPLRPKKRAKCIQRTLNLVCPGTWLCDLTQERYEVREKKVSKKKPRGLKAMGSIGSDSE